MSLAMASYQSAPEPGTQRLAAIRAGLERRALFLDTWQVSSVEAQTRARRVLQLERDGAERLAATPGVRALTKAWRSLVDDEEDSFEFPIEQQLVDSLDLRVVPGIYEGQPEGKPEALTVRVSSLYRVAVEQGVKLSLIWIGNDGAELRARTEPILPRAFDSTGFLMYIRAPSVVPGAWKLVPEIVSGEQSFRGIAVPVLGADEPDLLSAGSDEETRAQFKLLREHGIRPTFFRAFMKTVGLLSAEEVFDWKGARLNAIESEPFRSLREDSVKCWSVGPGVVKTPKCIVLLLRPEDERPESVLVGAVGDAWSATASKHEWWVLSTSLRLRADEDPSLLSLATELKRKYPKAALVLVGRGAALLEVQLAQLHNPTWDLDALVLSTVLSPSARPRNLPNVKGLFVASDASRRGTEVLEEEGRATWIWDQRPAPMVVTDLELPSLIADFLARD